MTQKIERRYGDMYCLVKKGSKLTTAAKMFVALVAIILVADVLGFMAWKLSGQEPVGKMFMGTITEKVVKMIVN